MARRLALVGATVIDGTGAPPLKRTNVVVDDDRIASVGMEPPPHDAEVLDVTGKTVLPGLIEAHAHLTSMGGLAPRLWPYGLVDAMRALLQAGFTTVRDLGATGRELWHVREAAAAGLVRIPRLVLCGQVISATCAGARAFPGMYREANGADELRTAVREQVGDGANVIKVMATGALTVAGEDVNPAQLTAEELRALVEEAHRLGLPVAAHAEGADGIRLSVAEGADTIEHGEEGHLVPESLSAMAGRGIVLVPTLSVFDHVAEADVFPGWMRERAGRLGDSARLTVEAARREGVAIAMGADAPPQGGNAQEIVRLADAGLSPLEAIASATGVAARACRLEKLTGTVTPGLAADLVIVDGDPLRDIRVLADPSRFALVLQGGEVVSGGPAA